MLGPPALALHRVRITKQRVLRGLKITYIPLQHSPLAESAVFESLIRRSVKTLTYIPRTLQNSHSFESALPGISR